MDNIKEFQNDLYRALGIKEGKKNDLSDVDFGEILDLEDEVELSPRYKSPKRKILAEVIKEKLEEKEHQIEQARKYNRLMSDVPMQTHKHSAPKQNKRSIVETCIKDIQLEFKPNGENVFTAICSVNNQDVRVTFVDNFKRNCEIDDRTIKRISAGITKELCKIVERKIDEEVTIILNNLRN